MPRRAIIYIGWGEQHVKEALASAETAGFLGIDRILITTEASLPFLPQSPPFSRVVTHAFSLSGTLAKSELWALVPEDYDSVLFLDTDTRVLMDITFGFDRAERFGIAAVMAPHYSLEHFRDFGKVMTRVSYPHVSTLQYNTGVVFFSRRPDVCAIFARWHELCCNTALTSRGGDQPYFTLAMEQASFNPYTLSPAYNYRNLGEQISGVIRIWHSHQPPPSDVNTFTRAWPPRVYKNNVRIEY